MTFFEKTKRFLEPLLANKLFTYLAIVKFSMWAIYALVSVYIIKYALIAIQKSDRAMLDSIIFFFIGFFFFYLVFSYLLRKTDWPYLYHNIEKYLYQKYIPKIIELDNNYLETLGTGRLGMIIATGKKQWAESLKSLLEQITKISITGGVMLFFLFSTNFSFGVTVLFTLIIAYILIVWLDTFAHKHRKIRTDENAERNRKMVRILMSKNELLQNNGVQKSVDLVMDSIQKTSDANGEINKALFGIFNIVRIVSFSIRIFTLVFIGRGVLEGNFTQAEFASILAMVIVFESFLFDSTEFYKNFTKDFSDIEKLWESIDDAPKMVGYHTGHIFSLKNKNIEIEHITYGYHEKKVFSDFSLTIQKGKKTALVGSSGGGKTTLMKLIAGYLHPEGGYISVLGNILDETALKTYYPHIGYLTQDPGVFDATIRENLISSLTQNTDTGNLERELLRVLKLAHCDFVFDLEKGLDTEIGERGVRLSGGQKQRLAIAKIFLKNPEIILLDEPTSALDSFSEELITQALDTLFQDRTVIIIAHRLQTVKKADEIIVIDGGEVIERGDHISLVSSRGMYYKMLELQSGF
ncbi:ABC transporter ATP-binding protein [Candidatus Gracilibacteria bacterium]|nr:ABC transporter ATP-binding protein [Candidatus Gracilibacteria bacterium]